MECPTSAPWKVRSTQFQDFFTLLGHYDWQINAANHFSVRGLVTRNNTKGFTGGHGQSETSDAFIDTEAFVNQGVSGVFALTTVMGRRVNELLDSYCRAKPASANRSSLSLKFRNIRYVR